MPTLWQAHSFTVLLAQPGTSDVSMLTYEATLSRIRIDQAAIFAPLNGNPFFETDASGWFVNGGTFARSTAQAHEGAASGLLTPDGIAVTVQAGITAATAPAAIAGQSYTFTAWVYSPTGYPTVDVTIAWLDSADVTLSETIAAATNVPAATWTLLPLTGVAPTNAVKASPRVRETGTPAATNTLHVDEATLIRSFPAGATRIVERSPDLIHWTTIRGGTEALLDAGAPKLDDAEFTANSQNHYRIRVLVDGQLFHTFRDSITVVLDQVWLKSVRRLFLNRTVTVVDFGDVERPGRSGVFPIVGRSLPVAVTDVHGSQTYELQLLTDSPATARDVDVTLASGDVVFIHGPVDSPVPEGYYTVGNLTRARPGRLSVRRVFTLPLTEVVPPDAALEGVTFTYRGLANRYATLADVLAAHITYREVRDLVGTSADVEVP